MELCCGGKIFVLGEYACIEGGPALLGTVGPLFRLRTRKRSPSSETRPPFAAQSPAGLYLSQHAELLDQYEFEWSDPYRTPIGVGSSSAQFLLAVAAVSALSKRALPETQEVLELYWKTVGSTQGLRPSGVDVVAQWQGGPLVTRNSPFEARRLSAWTDEGSVYILAYTGSKAKTHEHLLSLQARGFPGSFAGTLSRLNGITESAADCWERQDPKALGNFLNAYQTELFDGGLAPAEFHRSIAEVQRWPGVLGCKGAGAQGGDCVLLLVERALVTNIATGLRHRGWEPIIPEWNSSGIQLAN